MDTADEVLIEVSELAALVQRAVGRQQLLGVDERELLRMLREVRRFLSVAVPEEPVRSTWPSATAPRGSGDFPGVDVDAVHRKRQGERP